MSGDNFNGIDNDDDAIGDTVYSKKWLIKCLLKLVEFVKNEPDDGGERIEEIEDELCLLWDVTSEESVQSVLVDYSVHQILIDAVLLTNCPRFAEISIGILANLVHSKPINDSLAASEILCTNIVSLLSSTDVPFLVQLIRLINTAISCNPDRWIAIIAADQWRFFQNIQYLLVNCLNEDVLRSLFQLLNQVLYTNGSLGKEWQKVDPDYLSSLCQASLQLMSCFEPTLDQSNEERVEGRTLSPEQSQPFHHFWFIVQMLCDLEIETVRVEFLSNLEHLEEIFHRFHLYLSDSLNAILSYSAACVLFDSLFKLKDNECEPKIHQCKERLLSSDCTISVYRTVCERCLIESDNSDNVHTLLQTALTSVQALFDAHPS